MTKIENEMQYDSAMKRINELLKEVNDNTPEDDVRSVELVLLSNLVADYEDEHYPIINSVCLKWASAKAAWPQC